MNFMNFKRISVISFVALFLLVFGITAYADDDPLEGKTVNINTATVEELASIPLISEELAESIVEYRDDVGDFQVIEELLQIDGFDRALLKKVKTFLLLEGIGGDECTC